MWLRYFSATTFVFSRPCRPVPVLGITEAGMVLWCRVRVEGSGVCCLPNLGVTVVFRAQSLRCCTADIFGDCNQDTHRLLSSSFLGLPSRILNINHKKELLRGPWVVGWHFGPTTSSL